MAGTARFFGGAAILAVAVGISKVLGAAYKIPLGNALGPEGMAHFYAAYNVYNVPVLLSTAGLPAAVCRLTSQAAAEHRYRTARRIYDAAAVLFAVLGLVSGGLMLCFPEFLAALLHDEAAAALIRILAPSAGSVCLMAAIRGYTQGLGHMRPTAVSQIWESGVKLAAGLSLCVLLLRRGYGVETGAAGAMAGVSLGSVLALLYLLTAQRRTVLPESHDTPPTRRAVMRQLITIGLPVTLGSVGMSLLTVLDQSLTLHALHTIGHSDEAAIVLYGSYTFALTLFSLPGSFMAPVSSALLPALSAAAARQNGEECRTLTRSALRLTALMSFPMGVGLSVLAGPILQLLYPNLPQTTAQAAEHLAVLGVAAVFVCLYIVTSGILLALGREKVTLLALAIGGAVKVTANLLLSTQPAIHIHGAPWSMLLGYGVIAAVNLAAVKRAVGGMALLPALTPAALSTLVMAMAAKACYLALGGRLLPTIGLCAAIYGALCFALGAIDVRELTFFKKRR